MLFHISEVKGELMMNYFLALLLLAGFAGASGFVFGRPLPGTLRIASRADGSYIAVGPEYPMGFIPALSSLFFAALWLIPINSPISLASKPFGITIISDYIREKYSGSATIHYTFVTMFSEKFEKRRDSATFYIAHMSKKCDNIHR
jgi:hypothetical protein